jgi:hypothetical protein
MTKSALVATVAIASALGRAGAARAGDLPAAVVFLEAHVATLPGQVPEAAPARFAMLEDGQVFVGGTSAVRSGRLDGREAKAIEKRVGDVRKIPGLAGSVGLGPGSQRFRLVLRKGGRPLDMTVAGDPAQAAPAFRALAALVQDLAGFDHPSLRPFAPASYVLSAREGRLAGGCRAWPFPDPPSTFVPKVVSAEEVLTWPKGAAPASVCLGEKAYIVALRPLLPGEQP